MAFAPIEVRFSEYGWRKPTPPRRLPEAVASDQSSRGRIPRTLPKDEHPLFGTIGSPQKGVESVRSLFVSYSRGADFAIAGLN